MHGIGIALLVVTGIVVVLGSLRKRRDGRRKLYINKLVIFAVIAGVVLLGIATITGPTDAETQEVRDYQDNPPSIKKAPFWLQTPTRGFYIKEYYNTPDALILTKFYEFNYKKWELRTIPLPFNNDIPEYSGLEVLKR